MESWVPIRLTVPAHASNNNSEEPFRGTCCEPPRSIFFAAATPFKNVTGILVVAREIVLCACSKSRVFFLLSLRGKCQWCLSSIIFFFCPHIPHSTVWPIQLKMPLLNLMKQKCFCYCNCSLNSSADGQNQMKLSPSHLTTLRFHGMSSVGHC